MNIGHLLQSCHHIQPDWYPYIVNTRVARPAPNIISWTGDSTGMTGRTPVPLTAGDVAAVRAARHYSFMVKDGSLIQMRYVFDAAGKEISEASLSFLKAYPDGYLTTLEVMTRGDSFEAEGAFNDLDAEANVGGLRFDYAPADADGPLHGECHMHIAGLADSRLLLDSVPSPRRFVEFVFALCYPEVYSSHRLDAQHSFRKLARISSIFANKVKIAVPPTAHQRFARLGLG